MIPREWIISHRCSWMAVYVSCCNAQSKSHSDPLDIYTLSLFYQFPTVICLPSMSFLSCGETPLVNCGPRSNFLYIAITCLLYSHCLLSCILLLLSTRYAHSFVYNKPNLIVSWEQSTWLCYVQVPCCCWRSKALDKAPYKLSGAVVKLAGITFWSLAFSWTDKPWFLTEGKFATVLIIPSSWGSQLDGDLHQHRAASS
jgi:hypothetical protein